MLTISNKLGYNSPWITQSPNPRILATILCFCESYLDKGRPSLSCTYEDILSKAKQSTQHAALDEKRMLAVVTW